MEKIYQRIYKLDQQMQAFTALKCKETRDINTCIEEEYIYRQEMRDALYGVWDCMRERGGEEAAAECMGKVDWAGLEKGAVERARGWGGKKKG